MANGGTLTELVGDGRGKLTVLTVVAVTLATGMGWWASKEGRDAVEELRQEINRDIATERTETRAEMLRERVDMRAFVLREIEGNQGQSNDRMNVILERFMRNERDIEARIPRAEFEYYQGGVERRLDALERTVDALRSRVYGRSPRDSQQ